MSSEFNRIKKDWSPNNEKRYKWLYNLLKKKYNDFNYNIDDYLLKMNKTELLKFINKLELGDSSKEAIYFTISKWLQLNDPKNKNIIKFQTQGHKLMDKVRNKDADNIIDDDKQNSYQNFSYFLEILNNKDYTKITDIKEHMQYLLLALLILNPPLRTNFYSSAILSNGGKTEDDKNYVWLKFLGRNRAFLIVNKDKVSNSKQFKDNHIKNSISIEDNRLVDLLWYSLEKFPREYLFENDKHKKLSDNVLRTYLRKITKIPNINFDIMRSIYITHQYNTTCKTLKQKEELAEKMRHSIHIASRAYFKIKDDTNNIYDSNIENEIIKNLKEELEKVKIENNELKEQINKLNPKEEDKLYIKRRFDILYRLNKNLNVKPDTISKYNFIFDEEKQKYI